MGNKKRHEAILHHATTNATHCRLHRNHFYMFSSAKDFYLFWSCATWSHIPSPLILLLFFGFCLFLLYSLFLFWSLFTEPIWSFIASAGACAFGAAACTKGLCFSYTLIRDTYTHVSSFFLFSFILFYSLMKTFSTECADERRACEVAAAACTRCPKGM